MFAAATFISLSACGSMISDGHGGTPEQFRADSYICEQNAETLARLRNPERNNPRDNALLISSNPA